MKNQTKFILLITIAGNYILGENLIEQDNLCGAIRGNNIRLVLSLLEKGAKIDDKSLTCLDLKKENASKTLKMAQFLKNRGAMIGKDEIIPLNSLYKFLKQIIENHEYRLFTLLVPDTLREEDNQIRSKLFRGLQNVANDDWTESPAVYRTERLLGWITKKEEKQSNQDTIKKYTERYGPNFIQRNML